MVCRAEAMDRIRQGMNMRENQHELLVVSERDLFCFGWYLQVRRVVCRRNKLMRCVNGIKRDSPK